MEYDLNFSAQTFPFILSGIPVSLAVTFGSLLIAFPFGLLLAIIRIRHIRVLDQIVSVFVSFIRGTPVVVQIFVVYTGMPRILSYAFHSMGAGTRFYHVNPMAYAFLVFGLNTTAVLCEVFRSALAGVAKDQMEAAVCVGLSPFQAYLRIILPQALVGAVPNICNATLRLFKNTSLVYVMAVPDIMGKAKIAAGTGYKYIEVYLDVFLTYLLICMVMERVFLYAEGHLKLYKRGAQYIKAKVGAVND